MGKQRHVGLTQGDRQAREVTRHRGTLPKRCPLPAPGNRRWTGGKLLATFLQRPKARGGKKSKRESKQTKIKGTFQHISHVSDSPESGARPARRSAFPLIRRPQLGSLGFRSPPPQSDTPSGNRCALPKGKPTGTPTRPGASRFPAPHGVGAGRDALTQVTSGLCRNISTSCDTVTSMLSRGRAAQSGSGSRRRARETKAGREPTVRGCGPARPGRARGWGRGGEGGATRSFPRPPGALRCLAERSGAEPGGERVGSAEGSGAGPQHVAARVRGQVQPARADLGAVSAREGEGPGVSLGP